MQLFVELYVYILVYIKISDFVTNNSAFITTNYCNN